MAETAATPSTDNAFCMGCGYALRQLSANRCPECGRAFDPADARTLSIGRPLRWWQRRLLQPVSLPTLALALLGTAGMIWLGGWPHLQPVPWTVLRDEFRWPAPTLRPFTVPDIVFFVTAGLWAFLLVLFVPRRLALVLVPRTARRGNSAASVVRRRHRVAAILMVASACWLVFGWQHRIGRRWSPRLLKWTPAPTPMSSFLRAPPGPWCDPPVRLTPEQEVLVLSDAIETSPQLRNRMLILKSLVETSGKAALPGLIRIAGNESDPELLAWDLRLIGLCRSPDSAPLLIARLQDARPQVRAAAADAIGILRLPSYSVLVPDGTWANSDESASALDSSPPIALGNMLATSGHFDSVWGGSDQEHDLLDESQIDVGSTVRPILDRMMIEGSTQEEREAAARTLVNWPPAAYRLRVAEWGVWINNAGHMSLAKSVIDEIPPFVHRTGNPLSSFDGFFLYPMNIFKPIVHLTSDVPMAADIEVNIRSGRPWFAFPRPDCLTIGNEPNRGAAVGGGSVYRIFPGRPTTEPIDDFANSPVESLSDLREGYPWLKPHHRFYSMRYSHSGSPGVIYDLGVRWQSLIVCPARQPWMAPPTVPADSRFRWWSRLRDVPSSWLASRDEAERFLYYDGPTKLPVPVTVSLAQNGREADFQAENILEISARSTQQYPKHPFQELTSNAPKRPGRDGLYIDVHRAVIRGQRMFLDDVTPAPIKIDPRLEGKGVVDEFRRMLTDYGLTPAEAEGLVATWTPQFFQTEGRRFLLRMSSADYDWQCPMSVRPKPTEFVRLGIVLTEFDAKDAK